MKPDTAENRFSTDIQNAVEMAIEEVLDDRCTYAQLVGVLSFHTDLIMDSWKDDIISEAERLGGGDE